MPLAVTIMGAVEGMVDEAVVRRLIKSAGAKSGEIYGRNGKAYLRRRIAGFNNAAHRAPWIVLVDLDNEAECAPPLRAAWLSDPAPYMCFRIAVHEIEAWLLADRERLATFLHVPVSGIPLDPEKIRAPKEAMVNLARRSRRKAIRQDMVTRPGSGRAIGPAYSSRLIEFISNWWVPEAAEDHSDSLQRAIASLRRLVQETGGGG